MSVIKSAVAVFNSTESAGVRRVALVVSLAAGFTLASTGCDSPAPACPDPARVDREALPVDGQGIVFYGVWAPDTGPTPTRTECAWASLDLVVAPAIETGERRQTAAMSVRSDDAVLVSAPDDGPWQRSLAEGDYVACRILETASADTFWCADFSLFSGETVVLEYDFSEGAEVLRVYREGALESDSEPFDLLRFYDDCLEVADLVATCGDQQSDLNPEFCVEQAGDFSDCNYGENLLANEEYFACVENGGVCESTDGSSVFRIPEDCVWRGCER